MRPATHPARIALIPGALALALAGCQQITCQDHAICSDLTMDRGRQEMRALNPLVTNPRTQVNAAGDQSGSVSDE